MTSKGRLHRPRPRRRPRPRLLSLPGARQALRPGGTKGLSVGLQHVSAQHNGGSARTTRRLRRADRGLLAAASPETGSRRRLGHDTAMLSFPDWRGAAAPTAGRRRKSCAGPQPSWRSASMWRRNILTGRVLHRLADASCLAWMRRNCPERVRRPCALYKSWAAQGGGIEAHPTEAYFLMPGPRDPLLPTEAKRSPSAVGSGNSGTLLSENSGP